jgi:ribosomal protein S18 acetylase RimI-like enzyme
MAVLVPMSEAEYAAFLADVVPAYAADKVLSGQWSQAESLDLSRQTFAELLPQGLATAENYLFSILDEAGEVRVGRIWMGVQERAGRRIACVNDLSIELEHRRQGHATRALLALEEHVRALGLSDIGLHVFGHNVAAQALYAKLGYAPTNINLFKVLGPTGA